MKKNITHSTTFGAKQSNFTFTKWFLFVILIFGFQNSFAQKTWDGGAGSNNWGDANNWNANTLPVSTDNVTIGNGFTVSLNVSITVASLTVGGGTSGSLTVGSSNADRTLSVTGNVTINSGATINTTGNGGNTFNIGGNLSNAGTLTDGSGDMDIIFNGGTQTISGAGTFTFTDFLFSSAGTKTINSAITVNANWTNNGGTVGGTGTVTLAGNCTIGGSSTTSFPNLTTTGTITQGINTSVSGNFNKTAGTYTISSSSTSYSLGISGNFSNSGGNFRVSNGANNATLTIGGTFGLSGGTFIIQNSSSSTGGSVTVTGLTTISGTGVIIMDSAGASSTCSFNAGDVTFSGTGGDSSDSNRSNCSLDFGNGTTINHCQFKVSGNFVHSSTNVFYTSATAQVGSIIFNKSGVQTLSYSGTNSQYTSMTVNSGSTLQLLTNLTFGSSSGLPASTFTVNGTLDAQTFILGGASTAGEIFNLNSGATLITANTNGVFSTTVGSIANTINRNFNAAANYTFDGSANQIANFGNTTINNLTISNTGGSVTLNAAITAKDVTINSGGGSLTAGSFTHLVAGNWSNNGGTFVPGTGTISLNGTAQAIGGTSSSINFNNLSLSGGTKTFNKLVAVSGNLSIASGAFANPGSLTTHTAGTLTLGGITTTAANYGSTSTAAPPTVFKTDTYFTSGTTGYITVSNGSCTTAITVASIASNNVTTSLAKNGDVITVSFTTSETPSATPTATINGSTATVSGSGTSWSATKTVSGDTNGLATFSISIQNAFGCTASRTTVTNGSSVTVDTVAPTIPTISIASNNANTSLARTGNIITLSFTTSETPSATPTATINGASATVSGSGTSYTATRTVAGGDTNGVVPFSISIRDAAGNTAAGTATTNSSSVTVDTAAPTIPTGTIASNNANTTLAKSGDVITVSFTTSETPSTTPTVTISGGAASVSGSGTSYTATRTVLSGDTNGVAPFSISIADAAGNTASRTTITSGSSVTVDTVAPTIPTATIASNNATTTLAKSGDTITLTFTTSQTPAATPVVTINGASATVSGSGTSYTATRVVAGGDTNGVAPFSISIADAAGNTASRTTVTSGSSVTVDTVAPTIPTISIASNNVNTSLARTGNIITLSFTTSETPSATPTATINGLTASVSGSGTSYTATRTVAGGDTNGVVPFSISIRDATGNTASGTATTNSSSVTVDTAAPTIPTGTIASNNANTTLAKSGDVITVSFTTSETPATTPTVTISGGAASVSGSGTSYTATRTVLSGDTNGVAPFSISIADAAGNTASRTTTTNGSSVTIDTVAPTIPTATIASNNATTTLAKSGDTITLTFTTSQTPAATPVVTINGASATVSGSGTSYTATRVVAGGDTNGVAPFSISIADAAGNTASRTTVTSGSSVTVDTVAPTIPTISIASNNANTSLARSGNVITVSFTTSETPSATPTATINGASATVSGSGTSYTATRTVAGGDTNGVVPFSISIRDAAGNTALGTATTNSSFVTVDTAAPTIPTGTIVSNNATTTLAKSGDVITVSFTTSETPATTPTVTISGGAASVSGSGTSYTATRTVLSGDTNGVAPFSISIADASGNTASRTTTTNGSSVTIDTVAPTIPTATIASNNATTTLAKSGDTITLTFTTSQTPTATPVVTINGASATVSGSGTSYTATRVVAGGDTNGVAPFSISIADAAGNSASRTTTTNGSSVTIDTSAPTIPTATIASNNANTSLAKSGDIITLNFITSETPASIPAVTINGASASVSGSGTSYTATRTVLGADTNGVASFSISIADAAANSASRITTTDSSQVTIDTVAPTIPSASIASNNVNPTVAGTGDIITLSFTTSETPAATPSVTIGGTAAFVSGSGTSWSAVKTVTSCSGSVVIFSISISDAAGNAASQTTTTDSSQVTVNPTPSATIVSNNSAICSGFNATFTVNGSNGATLFYTITGQVGTQQLTLTGTNQTITASNATANVTLTLSSVVNANCSSSSFVTGISTVTVNALPIVTATNVSGCPNTNIALIGSPVGGSFSITNPYNGAVDTAYTYSYTDGNGCSNTSSSATVTLTTEIYFNNIDDNCDGLLEGPDPVEVDVITASGALSSMTSTITSSTATNTAPYSGAQVTYKFKVTKTNAPTSVAFVSSNTTSFTFSSASNAAHSSTYDVQATAIVNGEEQPYNGNTTSYSTPAAPTLPNPPTQAGPLNVTCAYTLATISSYIYANNSITYGATRYEFLVERMNGATVAQTVSVATTVPYFKLTNIVGIPATMQVTYGTTYRISVRYGYGATSFGSQIYTAYGIPCLVSTPTLPVASIVCGTSLASINAYVYASGHAPGASQFEFKVTRVSLPQPGELPIGTTEETVIRNVANFKLTMLSSLFVGLQKQYSVSVRYTVNAYGSTNVSPWSTLPSPCSLFTPNFPETQIIEAQCGVEGVPSATNQNVYADAVAGATQYRFRLYNSVDAPYTAEAPYDQIVDSPNNYVKLNQFPSLIAGVDYSVTVVAQMYGEYANIDLAKDCSITAPQSTPPASGPAKAAIASAFQATAYPNPFANNFMIAVKTGSQSAVSLKVYDMIGRLIEQRESTVSDLETATIGDRYPSGVYNLVVSQQDNVQTVRVVKR